MGWFFIILSMVLLFNVKTTQNYQIRVVFYGSPLDTVCRGIKNLDTINIKAVFNGTIMREIKDVRGQTYCDSQQTLPARIIRTSSAWYYVPDRSSDIILFNQETIIDRVGSHVSKIKLKSTIQNPVVFEGVTYQCILYGDGKEQHYGTDIIPPASVYIECQTASIIEMKA